MANFKQWLWKWVFNRLTKPVDLDQILTINQVGQVKLDGKILTPQELKALREEIKAFQNFRLKNVLFNTPKALAEEKMFTQSHNWDDMLAGKLMLYNLSIQENIILNILSAPQSNQPVAMQQNPYR